VASRDAGLARSGAPQSDHFLLDRRCGDPGILSACSVFRWVVEFASVIDTLRCATEWQRGMAAFDADVPPTSRIEFRIGINVGDIVVEDGDIFGDGVNVAARLEGLADPGGICVSARVQEDAAGRVDLTFDDLGDRTTLWRQRLAVSVRFDRREDCKYTSRQSRAGQVRSGLAAGAKEIRTLGPTRLSRCREASLYFDPHELS
jgi:class 3 adenylate cyclase